MKFKYFVFVVLLFGTVLGQTDSNNDPNWNWKQSAYNLYVAGAPTSPYGVTSPFYQDGISISVQDCNPEDGWVLVKRDFGRADRIIPNPHFFLYNRYQGLLRAFLFIKSSNAYSVGTIRIKWGTQTATSSLSFCNNVS